MTSTGTRAGTFTGPRASIFTDRRSSAFAGTGTLTRVALRRDRGQLLVWALGLLAGSLVCALHISTGFADEAARIASLEVAADNAALIVGRGLPMGTSHGAYLFFQYGTVFGTAFALFGLLFAVRHGRAEEEAGTRELVRAAAVGRLSGPASALVAGAGAFLVLAAALAAGFTFGGADPLGSALAGLGCALVGLVFLSLGLLAGQLASTARTATGAAITATLLLYILRVVADVRADVDPATFVAAPVPLGWFSPFSLPVAADPYGAVHPGPLLALAAFALAGAATALWVEHRREFGASLARSRPGPEYAPNTLNGPLGLLVRLQRGTLVAMPVAGAGVGAFAGAMALLALSGEDGPVGAMIREILAQDGPLYVLLLDYVMVLVGECAAIAGVLVLLRARSDESSGNTELVRAAGTGPGRWFGSVLAVGLAAVVLTLTAAGAGAAAVYLAQGRPVGELGLLFAATAAQLPAVLLLLGTVALVLAAAPRLTGVFAWTILALGVFVAELGDRLGLPGWVLALSPFKHSPSIAAAGTDWSGAVGMTALALGAAALATVVYRRRDLTP